MLSPLKKELEEIFRLSGSPDELFDAFRAALGLRIKDPELYKTLLRNKALSTDEIAMFAEKTCKEFPELSYTIYFCVGQIFASISAYAKHHDRALTFYKKAAESTPSIHAPYVAIAEMYNAELNKPPFDDVVQTIQDGINAVDNKSVLCFTLVNLYKNMGNEEMVRSFQILGELYLREGK